MCVSCQHLWSSIFCSCCEPCTRNTPVHTQAVTWTVLQLLLITFIYITFRFDLEILSCPYLLLRVFHLKGLYGPLFLMRQREVCTAKLGTQCLVADRLMLVVISAEVVRGSMSCEGGALLGGVWREEGGEQTQLIIFALEYSQLILCCYKWSETVFERAWRAAVCDTNTWY